MYYQVQTVSMELTKMMNLFSSDNLPQAGSGQYQVIDLPGDEAPQVYYPNTGAAMIMRHRSDNTTNLD